MELQNIDMIGSETLKAGFDIVLDDLFLPGVIDLQVIFVIIALRVLQKQNTS